MQNGWCLKLNDVCHFNDATWQGEHLLNITFSTCSIPIGLELRHHIRNRMSRSPTFSRPRRLLKLSSTHEQFKLIKSTRTHYSSVLAWCGSRSNNLRNINEGHMQRGDHDIQVPHLPKKLSWEGVMSPCKAIFVKLWDCRTSRPLQSDVHLRLFLTLEQLWIYNVFSFYKVHLLLLSLFFSYLNPNNSHQ